MMLNDETGAALKEELLRLEMDAYGLRKKHLKLADEQKEVSILSESIAEKITALKAILGIK